MSLSGQVMALNGGEGEGRDRHIMTQVMMVSLLFSDTS